MFDLSAHIFFGNDRGYSAQAIGPRSDYIHCIGMINAAYCYEWNVHNSSNIFYQGYPGRLSCIGFRRSLEDGRDSQIIGTEAFCLHGFSEIVDGNAYDLLPPSSLRAASQGMSD